MLKLDLLLVPLLALAGVFAPGWLGVFLEEDDAGRPTVTELVPDSPAQKAGIQVGDTLLAIGDKATPSVEKLVAAVASTDAGTKVKVKILRAGKDRVVDVVLGERPADLEAPARVIEVDAGDKEKDGKETKETKAEKPKVGLAPVKSSGRPFLGVALEEASGGVAITDVVDGSPAKRAGLETGKLLAIGSMKIANLDDVDKAMGALRAGQTVEVSIGGDEGTEKFSVTLGGGAAAAPAPREMADVGNAERKAAAEAKAKAKRDAEKAKAAADKARAEADKVKAEVAKVKADAEKAKAAVKANADAEKGKAEGARKAATEASGDVPSALRASKGKNPVLLVFGASWDANSKALKKSLADDSVVKTLGECKVVWVDTDRNGKVADEYDVQNLPHMVLVDAAGKRAAVIEGYQPPEMLAEKLHAGLGKGKAVAAKATRVAEAERADESGHDQKPEAKKAETKKADAKQGDAVKADDRKPEGERDLEAEIRQLRQEIRELRGMLREIMRERR